MGQVFAKTHDAWAMVNDEKVKKYNQWIYIQLQWLGGNLSRCELTEDCEDEAGAVSIIPYKKQTPRTVKELNRKSKPWKERQYAHDF